MWQGSFPGDGYAGMAVANEQDAGLVWESLVRGTLDRDEREKNSEGSAGLLWADTLALFRLVEILTTAFA